MLLTATGNELHAVKAGSDAATRNSRRNSADTFLELPKQLIDVGAGPLRAEGVTVDLQRDRDRRLSVVHLFPDVVRDHPANVLRELSQQVRVHLWVIFSKLCDDVVDAFHSRWILA